MFTIGGSEFLILVVVVLMLFGPDKIPQLARTVGRFMREFNKYKDIMESTIRMELAQASGPTKDELTVEERIAKAGAASTALIEADREAATETEGETEAGSPEVAAADVAAPATVADDPDEEDEE